jgi:hypothetical protein
LSSSIQLEVAAIPIQDFNGSAAEFALMLRDVLLPAAGPEKVSEIKIAGRRIYVLGTGRRHRA